MTSTGARVLYVRGNDYNGVMEAAEQVFFHWKLKMRQHWSDGVFLPISFVFSAHDPTRCSIKDVISSLLVSYFSGIAIEKNGPNPGLMKDQFLLQHAWTEMDLFKIVKLFARTVIGEKALLLLQNIDECDKGSRDAFWAMLSDFATTSEVRFKVVVTSRGSLNLDLLDELRRWPDIPVDTWTLADQKDGLNEAPADEHPDGLISKFCPGGLGDTEVRRKLEELRPMKKENLDMILRLIGDTTNWPHELSAKALQGFCSHLQAVTLASTPADVLGNALRDIADQDGLCWILKWLFMGRRPLSYRELAMVLCHCKRGEARSFQTPSRADVEDSLSKLRVWLRGIAESSSGRVRVREDVRGYLQNELSYIWAESTSPDAITTFLLDYLTAPDIQRRLDSMNKRYQSRVQSSGKAITPPLISDGQDIIFYAIQALPYHLSENPDILKSIRDELMADDSKLTAWSKAFWAMSNPFSRPELGMLNSPYETLLALGELKSECVAILKEMNASAKSPDIDSLSSAIREGNEDVALSIAEELISVSKRQDQGSKDTVASAYSSKIPWPPSFLWRAVWLNMVRLSTLLLNDGMDPDPDPSDGTPQFFPSPLYMAARLCHAQIMDMLIERGANIHVKRYGKYKAIQTAASHSNIHGVKSLVAKDGSLLESQEPETPLYFAALEGCWHMARSLLELGADPNSGVGERPNERWAPLVVAAEANHIKTARILLENGADPNICGPNDLDTPLWFAATKAASVDMVQLLLDKGADPNHELLQPPLVMELMEASLSAESKLAILEVLVRHSSPIRVNVANGKHMTPLLLAAEAGELSIVTWLLEHEADVNAVDKRGRSALHCAMKNGHVEVVRELLKWKPQLNNLTTNGQPLVELAVQDVAMMQILLDAGADIELANAKDHTALNIAVDLKKPAVVKLLVERKADMHHVGKNGWNAITIATSNPAGPEIIRVLVEAGADLRCAHPQTSNTPLHYVTSHSAQLARILLEFRTSLDLEQRNNELKTPLLNACTAKNAECVKLLIRAGADVNAEDRLGWTPLSLSARVSLAADAVDMLLAHPDVKIDAISKVKGTALMVACRSLNLEMVAKLLAHGADANISVKGISYDNTALKCACIPWSSTYSENKDNVAGIIGELIAHGADVNAMSGFTIYNAICAASFSADASIINLLLDKGASAQDPDPLGRLPIHFAAANGIKNFDAMAFAHRGDLLVCDRVGKNALHWAAQFGNVKTIEAIFRLLDSSSRYNKEYIDQPDIDGWTPLCWATRGMQTRLGPDSESEPRDYIQTVKLLIDHGANRSVKFTIGTGGKVETFTPVQMARLCGAQGEIIDMLETNPDGSLTNATAGRSRGAKKQSKKYKSKTAFCDICLHVSTLEAAQPNRVNADRTTFSPNRPSLATHTSAKPVLTLMPARNATVEYTSIIILMVMNNTRLRFAKVTIRNLRTFQLQTHLSLTLKFKRTRWQERQSTLMMAMLMAMVMMWLMSCRTRCRTRLMT